MRATKPKRLPTVTTKEETKRVLSGLSGTHELMAQLLYGSGLRLSECTELRVKEIDFAQTLILVRNDLYPCSQSRRAGCAQSPGRNVTALA